MTISFSRHQFPPAVIRHAVWLYVRFTLTYRYVEDLLAERGPGVSYGTGRRWVLKFGPLFARELRHSRLQPDGVGAPVLYEGGVWPSGRECRAEEAAGNKEVNYG
jgi:transposase-like protein